MSFFKAIWRGNLKHKKLYDERTLAGAFECEPITDAPLEELTFRAKYLGSTLVEKPSSKEATAEAVKTILSMAKAGGRKLQRVAVSLSLNGIKVVDVPTEETHLDVSIYRISYCSADATHSQVFAFIATNANETMECHAFLCPKRKTTYKLYTVWIQHWWKTLKGAGGRFGVDLFVCPQAQLMSLTLARVFRTAYDLLADGFHGEKFILPENKILPAEKDLGNTLMNDRFGEVDTNALLIDFHSELEQNRLGHWECFDEDTADNLNYSGLWDNEKKSSIGTFTNNHLHNFFTRNPWEDSRANLLCS